MLISLDSGLGNNGNRPPYILVTSAEEIGVDCCERIVENRFRHRSAGLVDGVDGIPRLEVNVIGADPDDGAVFLVGFQDGLRQVALVHVVCLPKVASAGPERTGNLSQRAEEASP